MVKLSFDWNIWFVRHLNCEERHVSLEAMKETPTNNNRNYGGFENESAWITRNILKHISKSIDN
jgi:hypothetical protein